MRPGSRMKRSWADVYTIREVMRLRDDRKWDAVRIEKELGLADGFVKRLGIHVKIALEADRL